MNPWVLRLILSLAPSIERLLIALIERWMSDRARKNETISGTDEAGDRADAFLEVLQTLVADRDKK